MRLTPLMSLLLVLSLGTGFTWASKDDADEKVSEKAESVQETPKASEVVVVPDANKDGKLTPEEKRRALELWSQQAAEESSAEKALTTQGDTDRDGKLEAEEKKRLLKDLGGDTEEKAPTPSKKGEKK